MVILIKEIYLYSVKLELTIPVFLYHGMCFTMLTTLEVLSNTSSACGSNQLLVARSNGHAICKDLGLSPTYHQ